MRLLVELGYTKFLFQADAPAATILAAFATATTVEEKWDGSKSRYALQSGDTTPITARYVHDSELIDEEKAAEMDADKLRDSNADLQTKLAATRKEFDDLKVRVDALTADKET